MSYEGESSISNVRSTRENSGLRFQCGCGGHISRKTSRTDKNPERLLFSCDSQERNGSHFFKWLDDALIEELNGICGELYEVKMEKMDVKREKMMDVKMEKMMDVKMEKMNVKLEKMNVEIEKLNLKMGKYNNIEYMFGAVVMVVIIVFARYYGLSYV
ncbi:PREDICTED: uncharacterized protein At4g04775-like [Tarenaya hassleriana]|uniref:uncharacterized protein At4g04775-like n=1 Tax=Tarenaya hassleriana TaxID=28532 RepID=UPI00053C1AEF|nr:PREDICTED: uncharacterized protein At4g04775-like [Tarenaya hassleriana]